MVDENEVTDGVKGSGEIEKDEDGKVAGVKEEVVVDLKKGCFSAVKPHVGNSLSAFLSFNMYPCSRKAVI